MYVQIIAVMNVDENEKINTFSDALKKVTALEDFAEKIKCSQITEKLLDLRTAMEKNAPRSIRRQTTILELWGNKN